MNIDDIRKLFAQLTTLMNDNELSELEVEQDGLRVHLKKQGQQVVVASVAEANRAGAPAIGTAPAQPDPAATETGLVTLTSPMVGTFYRTPSPEAEAFIEVGDAITDDTVVCIIEAMKVFNEIRAEHEGTVVDILVGNGEAVEYGQPLLLIEPAA